MDAETTERGARGRRIPDHDAIVDSRVLPVTEIGDLWDTVYIPQEQKDRLLAHAISAFTSRAHLQAQLLPVHGVIVLVGPPGTAKTTLARALASRTASALDTDITYLEVDPHALATAALGQSQKKVTALLGGFVAEQAAAGPCIVLLDEVETLAADRQKLSLEANPVDVHRATDAVLTQLDHLAAKYPRLLFLATSNFAGAIDDAFLSRADLVEVFELPGPDACQHILLDTIARVRAAFPEIRDISEDKAIISAAKKAIGLDGRQIRKAVISALSHDKAVALKPSLLSGQHVLEAIARAAANHGGIKERA